MDDLSPITVVPIGEGKVDVQLSIETNNVLEHQQDRINQQQTTPSSIKVRTLDALISDQPPSNALVLASTTTVVNATSVSFRFNVSDPGGREIFVMPLIGFYVAPAGTTVFTGADAWPNATYGMGNCPIAIYNDVNLLISPQRTVNNNSITRAIIRNNTGADIAVRCQGKFRIIANPSETSGKTS